MENFWPHFASFIFSVSRAAHFTPKFALKPHHDHVWKYGRHPICDGWKYARKKRRKKKPQDENIMSASATQGGHNKMLPNVSLTLTIYAVRCKRFIHITGNDVCTVKHSRHSDNFSCDSVVCSGRHGNGTLLHASSDRQYRYTSVRHTIAVAAYSTGARPQVLARRDKAHDTYYNATPTTRSFSPLN